MVGTQPLEYNPPRTLTRLPVLGEENVFHIEDIQEAKATPCLERYLSIHELATPTGAKAGWALVEVDEPSVGEFVLLE